MGTRDSSRIASVLTLLSTFTAAMIGLEGTRLPDRPYLGLSERGRHVGVVYPDGPAARAGLAPGDELIAIEDRSVVAAVSPFDRLRSEGARPTRITVQRDNTPLEVLLEPVPLRGSELQWQIAMLGASLLSLLVGTLVVTRKTSLLTVVFFASCYVLAVLLFRPWAPHADWSHRAAAWAVEVMSGLWPALILHFFLLFPFARGAFVRRPWLAALLYVPGLALSTLSGLVSEGRVGGALDPAGLSALLLAGSGLYAVTCLGISLFLYVGAFRSTPLPTVRRKLMVTLYGTLLGLLPLLFVIGLRLVQPAVVVPGDRLAILSVVLLPASFGYAIVRHGVFEREVILQRVLLYAGLAVLCLLVYLGVSLVLHDGVARLPGGGVGLGALVLVAYVLFAMSPLQPELQDRIDRWVYPDRYDTHRALRESALQLREAHDEKDVARGLMRSLESSLGVERAALFRPSGGDDAFAFSCAAGPEPTGPHPLRLGRLLADPLFRLGRPVTRAELEAELPYGFLPRPELEVLRATEARVLAPITAGARRLGILVVGPRAYAESYTAPDLTLLDGLVAQSALAMDNAAYREASHTVADRQKEMETARTLQQQLLPRSLPRLARFDLAARSLPCYEVGGDYYDCLSLEERHSEPTEIALAIGDVSGKGVPAALLMANVQATYRSEAIRGQPPADVLVALNRRLCQLERPDRFVSFFCARLDAGRRRLRYANAGHPPPLLLRAGGTIDRLERGGLLLGIRPEERYEAGEVTLAPGDLLVLYTDGVVERGGADAVFGETELETFAARHRHLGAEDLLERVLDEASRYAAEAHDDDTTLVVLKAL